MTEDAGSLTCGGRIHRARGRPSRGTSSTRMRRQPGRALRRMGQYCRGGRGRRQRPACRLLPERVLLRRAGLLVATVGRRRRRGRAHTAMTLLPRFGKRSQLLIVPRSFWSHILWAICGRQREQANGTPVSRARDAPRQIMASRETWQPARSSRRAATPTAIAGDARAASAGVDGHARRGPQAPARAKQNGSCIRAGGGARTGAHQTKRRAPSRSASDARPMHVHTFGGRTLRALCILDRSTRVED